MAATKPATLCSHLMPTGKLCRGVALRNERYCWAHIRNYRLLELDRAQNAALEKLSFQVQCMDLPARLVTLKDRLVKLSRSSTIARFPEICYLLTAAIDDLTEPKSPESNINPQLFPNQIPEDLSQFTPNDFNQMFAGFLKSTHRERPIYEIPQKQTLAKRAKIFKIIPKRKKKGGRPSHPPP